MNPLRVRARNYRTFGEVDLELPAGCVAVTGENGAGKSSVVGIIDLALFGAESRSLADTLTAGGPSTELELELTFEHAGETYRVRRGYSARGRGKSTVDFERLDEAEAYVPGVGDRDDDYVRAHAWMPLTCESAKATDELIADTIGLTRATFRASSFLAQGRGGRDFTEAQASDRKRIFAEVLGLDLWQDLADRAKTDRRNAEAGLQRLAGETVQARELVATKRDVTLDHVEAVAAREETARELQAAETRIAAIEERYRAASEQAGKRQALQAQLQAARGELEQLQRRDVAATDAVIAAGRARDELATLSSVAGTGELVQRERELLAQVADHERARLAYETAVQQHNTAAEQKTALLWRAAEQDDFARSTRVRMVRISEQPDAACDLCGQQIHDDAKAKVLAEYEQSIQGFLAAAARERAAAEMIPAVTVPAAPEGEPPTGELADVRARLAAAQQQVQQRARLEERLVQLQQTVDARPAAADIAAATDTAAKLAADLDDLEPVDLDTIKREGEQARTAVTDLRALATVRAAMVAKLEERLAQIVEAERRLADNQARELELQADVDLCAALEKAYGRDGIPALIIENSAIPYIETEAARILGLLGGKTESCRVELRTQAALKTGDGLKDVLDVVVVGEQGERAYETFSGGEKTRLNLALRIALARLLAHRRGAESRLLAIDEPDGLDAQGMSALVDVLRGLEGEIEKLYIISHVPSLRDAFDTTITVVQDGDHSRVVVGGDEPAVTEEVAA